MVFPLDIRTELYLGDTLGWVNVSGDVYTRAPVSITRGRQDEAPRVDPGRCSLTLNNRGGKYSPRNPSSPYHGLLGRNTPLRVSVPGTESYLTLDGTVDGIAASTGDPAFGISTGLDVRVEMTADWRALGRDRTLIGQFDGQTGDGWALRLTAEGQLALYQSMSGDDAGASAYPPTDLPERCALRVTWVADNGAGSRQWRLYWAESMAGPWTQFGAYADGVVDTMTDSALPLEIAPHYTNVDGEPRSPIVGLVHRAEVRTSVDGTVVAAPDFRGLAPGTTAFTDSAGLDWAVGGTATITDRAYRFRGEVSAWPQRWDVSGRDVWVPIQAAGVLRRMGQGAPTLQSTLRRRIPGGGGQAVPRAYWPMEEGKHATQAYSPLEGVAPLRTFGLNWASVDTLFGSDVLPTLGQGASIGGRPGPGTSQQGGWSVDMSYLLDTLPDDPQRMMTVRIAGAQMATGVVNVSTAGVQVAQYDGDGQQLSQFTFTDPDALAAFTGVWNRLQVFSGVFGGDTYLVAYWRDVVTGVAWWSTTAYSGGIGILTAVDTTFGDDLSGVAIGHLGIWGVGGSILAADGSQITPGISYFNNADDGYEGEYAFDRVRRLSFEEGVPIYLVDGPGSTEQVGPQRVQTFLDLVEEAAAADGGLLYEHRRTPNLAVRFRSSVYDQTPALVLNYASDREVAPPLEPVDDDQGIANDITVTREGGSSGRAVLTQGPLSVQPPPDGIGPVTESITLNLADDSQTEPMAHWRLHLSTVDEARYPTVHVRLHSAPHLIPDVLAVDVLDRIQVTNPPAWLPPETIDLLVDGYTETLGLFTWDVSFNCSPGSPWVLGTVGEGDRADTAGSELASGATAADTSLVVLTTSGPTWTTDSGEMPFDVRVGGEVVTVTAIADGGDDALLADGDGTATVSSSHVAPSLDAPGSADLLVCAWIPWDHPADYTLPVSMTEQAQTSGTWATMADATEVLDAAGATGTRTATRSTEDAWAAMSVLVSGAPSSTPTIEEHLSGSSSSSQDVTLTTNAGTEAGWWLVALHAWDNNDLAALPTPSGTGWTLLADTGTPDAAIPYITAWAKQLDSAGAQSVTLSGGGPDDNHARLYVLSNVTDLTAQTFTVTRSVNGIEKAQSAGTDVRLAAPMIVAL